MGRMHMRVAVNLEGSRSASLRTLSLLRWLFRGAAGSAATRFGEA